MSLLSKGGYMTDYADYSKVAKLGESVDDKVYFAGGAYTDGEDWVSVTYSCSNRQKFAIDNMVG